MMGALLLDGTGAPVRPAIIWADTRSTAQTATLVERVGMERGYATTGHRLNPTYSLSKIMWVRDHQPEVFDRARVVLNAKDFAVYRLTGVLATDPSDASSTNAFDQGRGDWSDELLAAADLPRTAVPRDRRLHPGDRPGHRRRRSRHRPAGRDAGGDGRRRRADGRARRRDHRPGVRRRTPTSARRPGCRWPPTRRCWTRRCAA